MSTETDREALARILGEVLLPDASTHNDEKGLLSYLFEDGVRLSFLCGPYGRLNAVAIQRPNKDGEQSS